MVIACFRVYAELNGFLPPKWRQRDFSLPCARDATTKHMIEAIGVPHTEVELVLVNGEAVGFDHRLRDGERVGIYPHFSALDITPLRRLHEYPLPVSRFIADAHLGALARLLRMAGFDTLYRNDYADREIVHIAAIQERIVLTRDRDLLKQRAVSHGCYVHAIAPARQLRELAQRLDLARDMRPFTRCLRCNSLLHAIAKDEVSERLPPAVREKQTRFSWCPDCRRIFWPGTHWQDMRDRLDRALAPPGARERTLG